MWLTLPPVPSAPSRSEVHWMAAERSPSSRSLALAVSAVVGARLEGDGVAGEVARARGRLADGDGRRLGGDGEDELRLLAARGEARVVGDGGRIGAVDREVVGAVGGDRPVEGELHGAAGGHGAEGLEARPVDRGLGVEGDRRLVPAVAGGEGGGAPRGARGIGGGA